MSWRAAHSLIVLRDQINAAYPNRNKASDGIIGDAAHQASYSDHNPDQYGIVRALDITHDPSHGCDIDMLTDRLQASRDSRISYLIANRLIMSGAAGPSPWVWRNYDGDDPHTNHFHLSVVSDSRADSTNSWNINLGTGGTEVASGDADFVAANVSTVDANGTVTGNVCGAHTALTNIWSEVIKSHKDVDALLARGATVLTDTQVTALRANLAAEVAALVVPQLDTVIERVVRRVFGAVDGSTPA